LTTVRLPTPFEATYPADKKYFQIISNDYVKDSKDFPYLCITPNDGYCAIHVVEILSYLFRTPLHPSLKFSFSTIPKTSTSNTGDVKVIEKDFQSKDFRLHDYF